MRHTLEKIFCNIVSVQDMIQGPVDHPLLLRFKPKYYEYKIADEGTKIAWYPYELYLSDLKEYYKKYYGLKQVKQNDSTLRTLVDAFKKQISYCVIRFTDNSEYPVVIRN